MAPPKKRMLNNEITQLEKIIDELQTELNEKTINENLILELNSNKDKLNKLIESKTQGAIIRSRVKWYEEGEKNSKYFLNLEKHNSNLKSINRLTLRDGSTSEDQKAIMKELQYYYQQLYTMVKTKENDQFLDNIEGPKVPQKCEEPMNAEITEQEVLKVLKSTANNKTPGEDGLPAEFYKVFWIDVKCYLVASYKYSHEINKMSITQRRGVLCLLPKKNDPPLLKNWRPISLLNQDYKLIAKLIAERIKLCLDAIIDIDQTGFIKGRSIGQNITNIIDIIHYCEQHDKQGY